MEIIDMTCPKCAASLKPDLDKGEAVCEYCGHHILIDKEDTIAEIRAKAQSRSYGYHKGRLEAEAEANKKQAISKAKIITTVLLVIVLFTSASVVVSTLFKPKVNPFDYIEVSFQGKDGDGEVDLEIKSMGPNIDTGLIDFDISKENNLSQGESISIQASSREYRLLEQSRIYIVDGLDEYLKDLDNIPEEALALIHSKSEAVLELNLDSSKQSGVLEALKPVKLFLVTDGKNANELYDVFEARFMTNAGEQIFYVAACFDDVIIRDGAQVSIDMSYGIYTGHLTQVQGWLHIMAYNSLEEIRTDILTSQDSYMELKELDLTN